MHARFQSKCTDANLSHTHTETHTYSKSQHERIELPRDISTMMETISGCSTQTHANTEFDTKNFSFADCSTLRVIIIIIIFRTNIFVLSSHLTIYSFISFEMSSIATAVRAYPFLGSFISVHSSFTVMSMFHHCAAVFGSAKKVEINIGCSSAPTLHRCVVVFAISSFLFCHKFIFHKLTWKMALQQIGFFFFKLRNAHWRKCIRGKIGHFTYFMFKHAVGTCLFVRSSIVINHANLFSFLLLLFRVCGQTGHTHTHTYFAF